MDLMSELAEIRAGGAAGREGRLQDIVFEANNLRCGADSFDLDWFMTKVRHLRRGKSPQPCGQACSILRSLLSPCGKGPSWDEQRHVKRSRSSKHTQ